MLRPSNKRAVANAVCAFCLLLLGIPNAYTADELPEKPSQPESVAIAKTAVEWLVLNEWGRPTLQSLSGKQHMFSTSFRNSLKSRRVNKFQVEVRGANDGAKSLLLYDRATRQLIPSEQVSPETSGLAMKCGISIRPFTKDAWFAAIRISNREFSLMIKREDEVYRVDEVMSEWIYD